MITFPKKAQYIFPKKGQGRGVQRSLDFFPNIYQFFWVHASLNPHCKHYWLIGICRASAVWNESPHQSLKSLEGPLKNIMLIFALSFCKNYALDKYCTLAISTCPSLLLANCIPLCNASIIHAFKNVASN